MWDNPASDPLKDINEAIEKIKNNQPSLEDQLRQQLFYYREMARRIETLLTQLEKEKP